MTARGQPAPLPSTGGKTLGQYLIQEELGAGAYGVVYRAYDLKLNRPVAVKVLDKHVCADSVGWIRIITEARAAAALNHPFICTTYDVAEENRQAYIAMELVEGRTLRALIPGHGLAQAALARYGAQIATALAHAHEKGVWHGDVSSRNVVVTPEDTVKILDFGLGGRRSGPVPPGDLDLGIRCDIQQLGVLLYEMATGEFPPVALKVLAGVSPPGALLKSKRVSSLPRPLRGVIAGCLTKDPARSYQRAQQIASDLEAAIRSPAPRALGQARAWLSAYNRMTMAGLGVATLLVLLLVAGHYYTEYSGTAPTSVARRTARSAKSAASQPYTLEQKQPARPDAMVWVNTRSKVYHCANSPWYGKTTSGEYTTQEKAQAAGARPAGGEFCP
jgi:protein kinase-like protein